ncbi:MAG: GNAT family N-acetyltransferase [Candidatus Aureabacteria bacterium]|nr:GNAT family N-acetyltransferase [Candidatus Auribacterota bacterium]
MIIENFRGDFDQIASLIQLSWAENVKRPLLYTSEFLSSFFAYPGADFSFAPALYEGPKPVAFIAGFPRRARFQGREVHILVSAFLSVASEHKRKGYGIVLWSELVKRAQAAGFDGLMSYCVEGEPMDGMILGSFRRLGVPAERLFSIPYLSRLIWLKEPGGGEEKLPDEIVEAFQELATPILNQTPLARIWSRPEAAWQCVQRQGALIALLSRGPRRGILTGYIMQIADRKQTKCLLLEDLFWGNLEPEERTSLVREIMSKAVAAGVQMVTVPVLSYCDMEPLHLAGFRPSTRTLHAYLSIWTGRSALGALPSMYLDVF